MGPYGINEHKMLHLGCLNIILLNLQRHKHKLVESSKVLLPM